MKRWLVRISAFFVVVALRLLPILCLSMLVTIAVAWRFAMYGKPPTERAVIRMPEPDAHELHVRCSARGWTPSFDDPNYRFSVSGRASNTAGVRERWITRFALPVVPGRAVKATTIGGAMQEEASEVCVGWPQPCLVLYRWRSVTTPVGRVGAPTTSSWQYVDSIALPDRVLGLNLSGRNIVPILPTWPGFAINTGFYAVIVWGGWLLFAGTWVFLRRRRRICRGMCPKCAYDLRGTESKTCPECGTTMKQLGSEEKRSSHRAKRAIP